MGSDIHLDVLALMQVLPGAGMDEDVDWPVLEAGWGTRFPTDYVSFMAVFGSGWIAKAIGVVDPSTPQQSHGGMTDETANARLTWEEEGADTGVPARADDVLAWGVTNGADILCWLTTDPDPDHWPVVVWGRSTSPNWIVYDCGMVEFLRRAAAGDFRQYDPFPFNTYLYEEEYGAAPMAFESKRDANRQRRHRQSSRSHPIDHV